MKPQKSFILFSMLIILALMIGVFPAGAASTEASPAQAFKAPSPKFTTAKAFDVSPALRDLAKKGSVKASVESSEEPVDIRSDRGPTPEDNGFSGDGAISEGSAMKTAGVSAETIPSPLLTFEGLSNQDNFNLFGFRVNPPDPMGDVGPNHYVELINVVFAVYDKLGNRLLVPVSIGDIWAGFAVNDCTDPSGDPVVLYDQLVDRWILTQFTTRGPIYYNCVAISQTGDPTGAYYRYAFTSGEFFPDYPKYGVWTNSYILTSRDFGPTVEYGISVYALEKNKMIAGNPKARAVKFYLDSAVVPINLMGDGLLPPDIDGTRRPIDGVPAPVVGTQDDGGPYGATFDALNIWELSVKWSSNPTASFNLVS